MATPLPAKVPPKPEAEAREDRGILSSRTSAKLEPPDPAQEATLEPGTIIAERYRIESLLGEGGMGKVYAAEHVHMRKQVAIKVLHPEMSTTPEVVARFEREAVAAGKIAHPNVAAATDFGRLEDRSFFLVLEYVAGVDLRAILKDGAVAPERALRIIRQITAAVGAAHAAGIVHRDLKPENIMLVDREGDPDFVKVLDFGIAKLDAIGMTDPSGSTSGPSAAPPLTKMGAVFGTPDYMSPEQALGQTIDARSDLYSIGVMLYELLTGERPFKGGAVTLMRKHVLEDAPSLPPASQEIIGPRYDAIIQKLLKKSAAERYASATDLLQAFAELEADPMGVFDPVHAMSVRDTALALPPASRASVPAEEVSRESSDFAPPKPRRYGVRILAVVVLGVAGAYWLGVLPSSITGMWDKVASPTPTSAASPAVSAAEPVASPSPSASSTGAPIVSTIPELEPAAPSDSSSTPSADVDEPATDDSATPVGAAASAPHHGAHAAGPHPSARPTHKVNRPAPIPRHGGGLNIPPPSQWFKN